MPQSAATVSFYHSMRGPGPDRAQGCRSRARAEATKGRAQRTFARRRAALSSPRQTPPRISGAASGSRIPTPGGSSSRSSFPQAGSPVS